MPRLLSRGVAPFLLLADAANPAPMTMMICRARGSFFSFPPAIRLSCFFFLRAIFDVERLPLLLRQLRCIIWSIALIRPAHDFEPHSFRISRRWTITREFRFGPCPTQSWPGPVESKKQHVGILVDCTRANCRVSSAPFRHRSVVLAILQRGRLARASLLHAAPCSARDC